LTNGAARSSCSFLHLNLDGASLSISASDDKSGVRGSLTMIVEEGAKPTFAEQFYALAA
jgi:hypothetical protein